MGTPRLYSCSRTGMFEEVCLCANPPVTTAEDGRERVDTSQQPSDSEDRFSMQNLYHKLEERVASLEKSVIHLQEEINKKRVCSDSVDTHIESSQRHSVIDHDKVQISDPGLPYRKGHMNYQQPLYGYVTQKDDEKAEENKKLKEKIQELEARNKELLSKLMGMHKDSENMNDPLNLSTVLHMYEMLRIHSWQKFRTYTFPRVSYKRGSSIIKKLFEACEEDVKQTITNIFEVLQISPLSGAMTNIEQGVIQEIKSILRYSYHQKCLDLYSKIVRQAGIDLNTDVQREFTLKCCRIFCLLLLQHPPVKAVWFTSKVSTEHLEHVDKKDPEYWRKPLLLWPIIEREEQVVVKGVVYDEE